jgi:hypothetical protein
VTMLVVVVRASPGLGNRGYQRLHAATRFGQGTAGESAVGEGEVGADNDLDFKNTR